MAQQQVSFFQEGVDRFRDAVGSIEYEFERVQKDLRTRRRSLEKQFGRRAKRLSKDLRKNPALKQVETLRKRATVQIEQSVDGVLSLLQIASKHDVQRIDRKLSQLNRRLRELDSKKAGRRANGRA